MPGVCALGTREPELRLSDCLLLFFCKFYSPLKISFVCFFLLKKNKNKQCKSFLNLFVALTCGYAVIHF